MDRIRRRLEERCKETELSVPFNENSQEEKEIGGKWDENPNTSMNLYT